MGRGGGGHSSSGHSHSSGGRSFSSGRGGGSSSHRSSSTSSFRSSSHHYSGRLGHSTNIHLSTNTYGRPYGNTYGGPYGSRRSTVYVSGHSTLSRVLTVICIILILIPMIMAFNTMTDSVNKSTIEREALKPNAAFDKNSIVDEVSWIYDKNKVLRGMEDFYKKTGVQPYLVITDNIDDEKRCSTTVIDAYGERMYTKLAEDNEKAIVFLFFEWYDSDVDVWYVCGNQAQTVMDSEATDILLDYAEALYTSDMSDEEYFAAIWTKTAKRIMSVTPTLANQLKWICIPIVLAVVIGGVVIVMKTKRKHESERAAETERILNSHVDDL